jgi:uracil phosphoribosyltransferase
MHYQIDHPLLTHKMTILRDRNTNTRDFREQADEITMLLAYEALKNVRLEPYKVQTPLTEYTGARVAHDVVLVPILRAGVGMLAGILNLFPDARVGFVGIYRDPETAKPITYYEKLPENLKDPLFFIIDPMLATGGSIVATIDMIKAHEKGHSPNKIKVISIISAPEGIKTVEDAHPDVEIYTGHIDEYLNDHKYIIPGLGDAGDRLFGTK